MDLSELISAALFHQVTFMATSMTWYVLRKFFGAWALFSRLLVSCSWGTTSTEGRTESRYVFDNVENNTVNDKPKKCAEITQVMMMIMMSFRQNWHAKTMPWSY